MTITRWAIAAAMGLGLMAGPAAQAAEVEMTLGSSVGPQDTTTLAFIELAKRVKERSNGRFEIEVIPIETLGFKNVDSLRVVAQGAVDLMGLTPYYVVRDEPMMGVFAPHGMLVEDAENLKIVDVQYEIAAEILESDKWNMVQVARSPFGATADLNIYSKEPVNTLAGLRGMKLRHYTKDGLEAFNALGVSTQIVPSSELYLALKTGVVDAAVYGPIFAKSQSIYEVTCCYSYLGAFTVAYPFSFIADKDRWAKVPADLQAIFVEESNKIWQESMDEWAEKKPEKEAYKWLQEEARMKEQPPFPMEDRRAIQAEIIKIWKANCAKMGDKAVGYCDRIETALHQ